MDDEMVYDFICEYPGLHFNELLERWKKTHHFLNCGECCLKASLRRLVDAGRVALADGKYTAARC